MVDSFNTPDPMPAVEDAPAQIPELGSRAGFLATTVGKLVVGGIALLVVVGAIGAILVMFVLDQPGGEGGGAVIVPAASTTSTASAETSPTERPADEFADTFVFRNIFKPTVKVTSVSDPGVESPDSENPEMMPDVPTDTLFLSSITTVDGVPVANLVWNGSSYALADGDSIGGTPWKVLSISGDTVVMLYGDARISLTVGQGISK